ncbi:transposase family protein [Streptomyces olivoreticuli]|uniref:transposase family protein n=1 Tax=Streptomyces olivoreticuli TaxID=68246 RepID=UPI002658DFA8|nr:transposase family protein [Streptomyces olivoreticuli]WKK24209.1 transposase family protein [Streptomyces olivoreticuli]
MGLYKSVVLVLFLLRQNPVQEAAAELFGVSKATVSRRWTALLPVVEKVLAGHVPDPAGASADRVVLIDGTLVTTWDWASEGTSMFSGKHRDTGFSLQFAATLTGDLARGLRTRTGLPPQHARLAAVPLPPGLRGAGEQGRPGLRRLRDAHRET